jgi:hypothetical protein
VTTISYYIEKPSVVDIVIYDLLGRVVHSFRQGPAPAGKHKYQFSSAGLASGIYFYTLKAGTFEQTRKMVIVK